MPPIGVMPCRVLEIQDFFGVSFVNTYQLINYVFTQNKKRQPREPLSTPRVSSLSVEIAVTKIIPSSPTSGGDRIHLSQPYVRRRQP